MAFSFEPVRDSTNIRRYPRDFSIYNDPTTIVLSPTFYDRFNPLLRLLTPFSLTTVRSTSTLASPLHQFFAFLSSCLPPVLPYPWRKTRKKNATSLRVFTLISSLLAVTKYVSGQRKTSLLPTSVISYIFILPARITKIDRRRPSIFILPRMALLPV